MLRWAMTLGLSALTAGAALAQAPAPRPAPAAAPAARAPREFKIAARVHALRDGQIIAGEKLPPEAAKELGKLVRRVAAEDKIGDMTVFQDRFYRTYTLTPELMAAKPERWIGREVTLVIREIAPGRSVLVDVTP